MTEKKFNIKEWQWLLISFIIGLTLILWIYPPVLLDPGATFINAGDQLQHFIGWSLFRDDAWHWPLTKTTRIFYPTGISIVYTDSYPIFALIFKCFSRFLPKMFYYFGIILVFNVSLMFYSGRLLIQKMTGNAVIAFFSGFLFMFAPAFMFHLKCWVELAGQWVILLALIPILTDIKPCDNKKTFYLLLLLIFISLGMHFYLAAMLVVLVFAYIAKIFLMGDIKLEIAIKYALCVLFLTLLSMYFFGYFVNGSDRADWGFGDLSINLNSPFNALESLSKIFSSLPLQRWQTRDSAYLGAGIFCMIPFALWRSVKTFKIRREFMPFVFLMLAFFLFSLSNKIYLGNKLLLHYSVPKIFGLFRHSCRFFWPIYYSIFACCITSVYRSGKFARGFLYLFIALQIYDVSGRFYFLRSMYARMSHPPENESPRWGALLKTHPNIFTEKAWFPDISIFAYRYMANLLRFYLARRGTESAGVSEILERFNNGLLLSNTLYVMKNKKPVFGTKYEIIDGYHVYYR